MLASAGATVLLAAVVGTSSAGRLEASSRSVRASWTRFDFSGGFGTIECEVVVNGAFHERTIAKIAGALTGYVTAANITRCARGGATVLRETLPWHVRFSGFSGTLPNITGTSARVVGLAFSVREPFGVTCLARVTAEAPATITFSLSSGTVTTASAGGEVLCGGSAAALRATTSNVDNGTGSRLTVTLI
jgi:hypothetical protein